MDVSRMTITERIQEFESYFSERLAQTCNDSPFPLDKDLLVEKALEYKLPVPYYNENDEYVVNWEGYE